MEESVRDEEVERRASGNAKAKLAKPAFIANDGPQHQKHPCLIEAISSSRLILNTFQACHFDKAKTPGKGLQ
jgi:hypothetical protein